MTMQARDPFFWEDEEWVFLGAEDVYTLFDPKDYGLEPSAPITSCWKGFIISFALKGKELFLDQLKVYCENGIYPDINGVSADSPDPNGIGFHPYRNVALRLHYSGTITIGQGFSRDPRYAMRAFTGPHMYERVHELVFEDGVLQKDTDTSGTYTGF